MIDYKNKDKMLFPGDVVEWHQGVQSTGISQPQQLDFLLITGTSE